MFNRASVSGMLAFFVLYGGTPDALADEPPIPEEQVLAGISLIASPNPVAPGGTVSFYATCNADTDIWDNLGHSGWREIAFSMPVNETFTWTASCAMTVQPSSGSLTVTVDSGGGGGGGGGGSPPPPPPPDQMPQLEGGAFELGASGSENPRWLSGRARCKWQDFRQTYHFVGGVDMLRYEGTFKVCYVPFDRIISVEYMFGDAAWWCCGWWWQGNDQGYPTAENHGDRVIMRWRGTVEFCVYPPVCIGNKHVGVRITFYPSNTMERAWSVE